MFIMEEEKSNKMKADIRIVGVGGGGSNALEIMIKEGIQGVQFIAINTDHQALAHSSAKTTVQLGAQLTKGLGAGANPDTGRRAAVESYEDIVKVLKGADMVFVTAGMGGGTGTGGAPLVAQAADELGLLTVGIVTKPFVFEGPKRMKQAERGIMEMKNYVDTLIVIPNEKLLEISGKDTPLLETFKITDNVLLQAVKGIAELVSVPGLINLDFADIKTVMLDKGMALMGRGVAEGEGRATKAINLAISSPLLEGLSIKGATGMIVNITASSKLSLREVQEASSILTQLVDDSADVIVGTVIDENMGSKLSITVIATGFSSHMESSSDIYRGTISKQETEPILSNSSLQSQEMDVQKEPDPFMEKEKEDIPPFANNESLVENTEIESESSKSELNKKISFTKSNHVELDKNLKQQDVETQTDPNVDTQTDPSLVSSKNKRSPKDILLSKVKEYALQREQKKPLVPEDQISMDWKESQLEENPSSPFESCVEFSDEDMV